MSERRKPVVGETLYLVECGRHNRDPQGKPATVSKVGSKYFSVDPYGRGEPWSFEEFELRNWAPRSIYPTKTLHESEQAYLEKREAQRLWDSLSAFTRMRHASPLSLTQLRAVAEIIPEIKLKAEAD